MKLGGHRSGCSLYKQSRSSATVTTSTTQQASTVEHDRDNNDDDNQASTAAAETARKLRDDPMDCADIESIHENEF